MNPHVPPHPRRRRELRRPIRRSSRTSRELARLTGAELLLVHVADGWAARHFDQLKLRESEEMKTDRAYLDRLRGELDGARLHGRDAARDGRSGDRADQASPRSSGVDLIAMSTHGHRFVNDVLHGATADKVRHLVKVPVLLLRAQ